MYAAKFNSIVNEIITTAEKKAKTEIELGNIDTLKRRIRLLKTTMGLEFICEQALPVFVRYKNEITNRDEAFFLRLDVVNECVDVNIEEEDEFIFSLIDQMREYYKKSQQAERNDLWDKVLNLFELSLKHSPQ